VLRLLGELERIAEKWTDALDRRTETVKRASKNSALLSYRMICPKNREIGYRNAIYTTAASARMIFQMLEHDAVLGSL
jgi:hypothetical protein